MKSLLTLAIIIVTSVAASAQTVSVVADDVPYAGAVYYFHQRNVARTTTGILMVAWATGTANGSQVMNSTYDEAFKTWSPPVAISNAPSSGVAIQPALAADEQGNIHAVWQERGSSSAKYQMWYSKYDGVSWTTPKQVSVAASVRGEEGTIEVDSKGILWIVYNNDGEGVGKEWLFVVKSTDGGTTWSTDADTISVGGTFGASIEVGRVALVAGPGGKMVAVWDNHMTGSSTNPRETFVNQYDGTNWRGQELLTDTAASAAEGRLGNRYSAATIGQNGNIYVFYNINRSSSDTLPRELVMHKKAWNDSWSPTPTTVIESHPVVGMRSVSAVVDSSNVIHLAYRRDIESDTTDLDEIVYRYSVNSGATWSTPLVLSRLNHDGGYVTVGNRVRAAYGIDVVWRESKDPFVPDQDSLAVLYANIPYSAVTEVAEASVPEAYELLVNYPNPFNPSTTIEYRVAARGRITLAVYDALGREIRTLLSGEVDAGGYRLVWDGRDNSGQQLSSGVYLVRLLTERGSQLVKTILLK